MFSEAKLRYDDGDYHIVKEGTFVKCAVTGQAIPIDQLRYWSVDRQEAYASVEAVVKKHFPNFAK